MKRIAVLLLLAVVLATASNAMAMAYRELAWNDYTLTMVDVRTLEQVQDTLEPPEGKTFLQITVKLPEDLMQDPTMRGELFFVILLNDMIPSHNTIYRLNAEENLYACIFTVAEDFRLEDYEFGVSGGTPTEIEPPDGDNALADDIFDSDAYDWYTGLDQRI